MRTIYHIHYQFRSSLQYLDISGIVCQCHNFDIDIRFIPSPLVTLSLPIDSKILRIQYLLIYESGKTAFKGFLPKHH